MPLNHAVSEIMILDNLLDPNSETLADQFRNDTKPDAVIGAHRTEMMVRLVHHLENDVPGPVIGALKILDELSLTFVADKGHATHITISVDAIDYAPLENGMPPFHYRVNYTQPDDKNANRLSVDRRSNKIEDVADFVLEAIASCR